MKDERLVQEEGQYGNICSSFLTIVQKWPLHLSDAAEKQNSFRKRTKSQEKEKKNVLMSHISLIKTATTGNATFSTYTQKSNLL